MRSRSSAAPAGVFGLNRSEPRANTNSETRDDPFLSLSHSAQKSTIHTHNNNNNHDNSNDKSKSVVYAPLTPIASFSSEDLSRMRRQSPDAYRAIVQYEQLIRRMTAQVETKDVELQRCIDVGQEVLGRLDEMQSRCTQLASERDEAVRRARREALELQKRISHLETEQSRAKDETRSHALSVTDAQRQSVSREELAPEIITCATQSAAVYNQLIDIVQHLELWSAHATEQTNALQNATHNTSRISPAPRMHVPALSSFENNAHAVLSWLAGALDEISRLVSSFAYLSQQIDVQRQRSDAARQAAETERNRALRETSELREECTALRNALATLRGEVAAIDAETDRMQSHESEALRDLELRVAERDASVAELTKALRNAQKDSATLQDTVHRTKKQKTQEMESYVLRFEEIETELKRARERVQVSEAARDALEKQLLHVRQCIPNVDRIHAKVEHMAHAAASYIIKGNAITKHPLEERKRQAQLFSAARENPQDSSVDPSAAALPEKTAVGEEEETEEEETEETAEEEEMEYNENRFNKQTAQTTAMAFSQFVCDWATAVERVFLRPVISALGPIPSETPKPNAAATLPAKNKNAPITTTTTTTTTMSGAPVAAESENVWAAAAGGVVNAFAFALSAVFRRRARKPPPPRGESESESAQRCTTLSARIAELEECLALRTQTQSAEREQWRDAVTLLQTERAEAKRPLRAARERLAALKDAWRMQQERIEAEASESKALREVNRALERRIEEVEREREPLRQQLQCLLLGNPWYEEGASA